MSNSKVVSLETLEARFKESAHSVLEAKRALSCSSALATSLDRAFSELMGMVGLCQMAKENPDACRMIEAVIGHQIEYLGVPQFYFKGTDKIAAAQHELDKQIPGTVEHDFPVSQDPFDN